MLTRRLERRTIYSPCQQASHNTRWHKQQSFCCLLSIHVYQAEKMRLYCIVLYILNRNIRWLAAYWLNALHGYTWLYVCSYIKEHTGLHKASTMLCIVLSIVNKLFIDLILIQIMDKLNRSFFMIIFYSSIKQMGLISTRSGHYGLLE